MRRARAGLGLAAILAGAPIALLWMVGPPSIPSFAGSEGLSGNYVPAEAVFGVLGLLAWVLCAYLVFAILLNVLAALTAAGGRPWQYVLANASELLTPRAIRRLVEWTVGGVFLVTTVSGHVQASRPLDPAGAAASDQLIRADAVETAVKEAPQKATYRVRVGDSLWRIGEDELGSGFRWRRIFELNRGRRFRDGRSLTNPHLIHPGWRLEVSRREKQASGSVQNKDHTDAPTSAPTPSEPVTPILPEEPSVTPRPEIIPAADPTKEDTPDIPQVERPELERPKEPTLRLPSGLVVAASFASGLLTARVIARLRERRTRRLSKSAPPVAPEPRLAVELRRAGASPMAALPDVALDAVAQAWTGSNESWPRILMVVESQRKVRVLLLDQNSALPADTGGSVSPLVRFSRAGEFVRAEVSGPFGAVLRSPTTPMQRGLIVPLGRARDDSAIHAGVLATAPASVSGPKASALVRQMVVSYAVNGPPDDLKVILLGIPPDVQQLDQLAQVTGSYRWDRAAVPLRDLQAELVKRARLFLEEGVEDIWAHLAHHPDERLPALLLVAGEPPAVLRGLVEGVAQQASSLGAALLAIGWEPAGSRLSVHVPSDMDLRTDLLGSEPMLPLLLEAEDAEEAIEILRQAHPSKEEVAEPPAEPSEEKPLASATPRKESLPVRGVEESEARASSEQSGLPPDVVVIRSLGPLEISRAGRPLRKGWRSKSLELLAYLVAHPRGASKDRIVEELWPEIDPHQGTELLYVVTSSIRRRLRSGDDSGSYVDRQGEVFRLEERKWWIDLWEFERLVDGSERAAEAEQTIRTLRDATRLYKGEFCSEHYYPWAEGVRERLRALFVRACARLADALSDAGEDEEALLVLDRGIDADPVCEDLSRRAMVLEASLGRRAAALVRYRKLEATLDAELSVEPDPETQALARQLMPGDSKAV
jgi:DNA-binding SARP family transcriptional activator